MPATITQEHPTSPDARLLISELDAVLEPYYPRTSRHGYSVDKLVTEQVPFFVIRYDGVPAACGGVKLFGTEYGEVKRMFVRPQFRGLGLAKMMLHHLQDYARANGVSLLRLETGIYQTDAIAMYEKFGFTRIEPFGEYKPDPLSRCYEKKI